MEEMSIEKTYRELLNEFLLFIDFQDVTPDRKFEVEIKNILRSFPNSIKPKEERYNSLIYRINEKLDLNNKKIKNFIDSSAKLKIYFNYHEKKFIRQAYDKNDRVLFEEIINERFKNSKQKEVILNLFSPINEKETIIQVKKALSTDNKSSEIALSIFSSYIFDSFSSKLLHSYFSGVSTEKYTEDFFQFLQNEYPLSLTRDKGLSVLQINDKVIENSKKPEQLEKIIFNHIEKTYQTLSNHCYYSILLDFEEINGFSKWDLYYKIVLFSEKFIQEKTVKGYFHPDKIRDKTSRYINELKVEDCDFNIANIGFTYKDCFVLKKESEEKTSLLILFEKNERNESLIPCPACRTTNVRGNSYPVLGVKSWECNNYVCPDKSLYNRGKRYSLSSLIKQEAINDERNTIDVSTIRKWQLDVVNIESTESILEFLIKHYSLINDLVELVEFDSKDEELFGRRVVTKSLEINSEYETNFFSSSFFNRYKIKRGNIETSNYPNLSTVNDVFVYNGDSEKVLYNLDEESIDSAITSPPYYNAKEYSQWENIYTYLYDMYNNAIQVHRVLKPGGAYLYNIFDYFDNENNIVFSAMGKKRMILGAYIIDLFKDIGFEFVKNIAWNKGHVQGNRSFNQGNNFPYYQAPLNCYEHILYFRKKGEQIPRFNFPDIVNIKPFYKMVKGVNTLGHTAPFPKELPYLLCDKLDKGAIVLDPYAGSFTTARACMDKNISSINIEMSEEYCQLGLKLINTENKQKNSPSLQAKLEFYK
ncbi:site-specific DNA-methyltransferase [Litoribacter alkaliphilus]|uniref:site-specific DNA-methyltransferase (cytosine-N(4)-specific) n=1 Tax=Litoribacter ruber TaxID=702568 RepID=A0AAP2G2K4_9BACT|nr:site-specific DNA-methyltransferase [Litoribacter alkaliphilus]MBS9525907.1 site-specific DNA-methyltransferase [Litoribacter alkaliphilus]